MSPARFLVELLRSGRRTLALGRWLVQSLVPREQRQARGLLMVYDLGAQPLSVGDVLVYQEAALALREVHGLGRVDFAFLYDPVAPTHADDAFAHVDSESIVSNLGWVLQAAHVNPFLGSVLLFAERRGLEDFVGAALERSFVWPGLARYASGEYLYYEIFNRILADYHRAKGRVPHLHSRGPAREWATRFVAQHARGSIPVSVQLRRNPHNPARNSDYPSWGALFQHARRAGYPVKFLLVCGVDELDPALDQFDNVVPVKRYGTNVEQDLAVIDAAAMHLGAASGPGTIALFSDKPYCLFGVDAIPWLYRGMRHQDGALRFFFADDRQRLIAEPETPESLRREFERLWPAVSARPPQDSGPHPAPGHGVSDLSGTGRG